MSTHPTYYEDNSVSLEAIDVMDYLHPALANAFKYLVRAGSKPDNSWESDAYKALAYISHWQRFKDIQPEHPEAYAVIKLFCNRTYNDLRVIIAKSNDLESFVDAAEEYLCNKLESKVKYKEYQRCLNQLARMKHKKIPFPELKD